MMKIFVFPKTSDESVDLSNLLTRRTRSIIKLYDVNFSIDEKSLDDDTLDGIKRQIRDTIGKELQNRGRKIIFWHPGGLSLICSYWRIYDFLSEWLRSHNITLIFYTEGGPTDRILSFEKLKEFLQNWGKIYDVEKAINEFKTRQEEQFKSCEKEYEKKIVIHRLMHLFLPLDIDLMGIEEVGESEKVEYLKEVLDDKPENYYKRKLLDLTTFVAKIDEVNSITANVDKKSIGKSIKEIIEESNIEVQDKQDMEKNLFALCAINESGNAIDRKSPIYEFMNLLDAKIGKKNSGNGLNTTDVSEILEFFKNSKEEKFAEINSFHDWYCEVFRCLDSLKEKVG